MKPMLKYRGGKYKEIEFFKKYIPEKFDTYYEPFLGGGAVYFHLAPSAAVLNDINAPLMTFYDEVRNKYDSVRKQLDFLQVQYEKNQKTYESLKNKRPNIFIENKNENLYYSIRDEYNGKVKPKHLKSVVYYFINKTAFSGMIRYNSFGEYNVPFGRYKNFNTNLVTPDHSQLLKKAKLQCGDFSLVFSMPKKNDFMFIDPPYDCTFTDYGNVSNGFGKIEHVRLAQAFKSLKCKALMILGKTEFTKELYGDYIVGAYKKSYNVNIRNRFKSDAEHLVILNF